MKDPRIEKLARLLCRYSLNLKPRDVIAITSDALAAPLIGHIHHHDPILLHQPDQQDQTDEAIEIELCVEQDQDRQAPHRCRWQRGEHG